MKTNLRLAFLACLASGLNLLAAETPSASPATTPFTATAKGNNIMVRGLPTLTGDRLGRLQKDETVQVLEVITLAKPKKDEPAQWYKIAMPTNCSAWVSALFVDTNTMSVKPKNLSLRAGPGEEYNRVGTMNKGATLKVLGEKGGWLEVAPSSEAFAFVAAEFFKPSEATPIEAPAVAAATPATPVMEPKPEIPAAPVTPPPTEVMVAIPPPVVAAPTNAPAVESPAPPKPAEVTPPVPAEPATPAPAVTAPATPEAAPGVITVEPPPRRVVMREGIVKMTMNLNSPSWYILKSLDTDLTVNYLHTTDTNLVLKNLLDKRVVVTGEEAMDRRWASTPVLTIEKIQIVP